MPDTPSVRLEPDHILIRIETEVLSVGEAFMCRVARVRTTAYQYTTGERMASTEETIQVAGQDDHAILVLDLAILLKATAHVGPEPAPPAPADTLPVDTDPGF